MARRRTAPLGPSPAGFNASYWCQRLFKNTFTRDGQRLTLRRWSVKIQHQGRRQTFSLAASARPAAAREAFHLHQTIVSLGWEAVASRRITEASVSALTTRPAGPDLVALKTAEYWKPRLLRRKHRHPGWSGGDGEFSVRIGHGGISHYFPLDTCDESSAPAKALGIYQAIVRRGWEHANRRFSRELTLGFHWASDPLAWTYTTIHTYLGNDEAKPNAPSFRPARNIAVVDCEAGIARAIVRSLRPQLAQFGFVTLPNGEEALRQVRLRPCSLVLANHSLPDMPGDQFVKQAQALLPQLPTLIYSVYEDSDELFKATPGGAAGYLLKRTTPEQMLAPIMGLFTKESFSPPQIVQKVRQYFQSVTTLLHPGEETHQLGQLTPREKEILGYLSKGFLDKEIAQALGISVWTVHGHMKNIFEKLQVHSRTEAVVKYLQK